MNKYNPPPEVVAAQDHLAHVVHSVMQPQRIFDRYSLGILRVELRAVSMRHPIFFLGFYFVTYSFLTSSEGRDQGFI